MSSHPMKIAVATDATFGSTMATTPPSSDRTPLIVSQRRARLSSSAASAVVALMVYGVADGAVPMPADVGRRPSSTSCVGRPTTDGIVLAAVARAHALTHVRFAARRRRHAPGDAADQDGGQRPVA